MPQALATDNCLCLLGCGVWHRCWWRVAARIGGKAALIAVIRDGRRLAWAWGCLSPAALAAGACERWLRLGALRRGLWRASSGVGNGVALAAGFTVWRLLRLAAGGQVLVWGLCFPWELTAGGCWRWLGGAVCRIVCGWAAAGVVQRR